MRAHVGEGNWLGGRGGRTEGRNTLQGGTLIIRGEDGVLHNLLRDGAEAAFAKAPMLALERSYLCSWLFDFTGADRAQEKEHGGRGVGGDESDRW